MKPLHHHHRSKHKSHRELEEEEIAEFMSKEEHIHEENHSETNHPYKHFLIGLTAFLIIAMFVSFSILGPVNVIVQGQLRSSTLDNNVVYFGNYSLYFAGNISSVLSSMYADNQINNNVESSACLIGNRLSSHNYEITDIFYPTIFDQSRSHVSFSPCPAKTVVMLHTHPFKSCLASDTDLNTLKKAKTANEDILMIVMCEEFRFSVYSGD